MSYPKVNKSLIKDYTERSAKVSSTKENLKQLLVNKFRVKYVNTSNVANFDSIIRNEVDELLMKGKTNEDDLLMLDRKLQQLLSVQPRSKRNASMNDGGRGENHLDQSDRQSNYSSIKASSKQLSQTEMRDDNDDQRSKRSVDSHARSRSTVMQGAAQAILEDEDHWNKIVMNNVETFRREQEQARQKIKDNQSRMKEELERQVTLTRKMKEEERRKELVYMEQLRLKAEDEKIRDREKQEVLKQKLIQEQKIREVQMKDVYAKKNEDQRMEKQLDEQRKIKMQKDEELQRGKDKQKQEMLKKNCYDSLEENKKLREMTKQQDQGQKIPDGEDLLGQLFKVKKHQSYDRRAKNDQQIELIKDQILGNQDRRIKEMEISLLKTQKEREEHLKRLDEQKKQSMKQKEFETKMYLELQLQEKQERSKLLKLQSSNEGQYIQSDVIAYREQEQQKKQNYSEQVKEHKKNLELQISGNKKGGKGMDPREYHFNKSLLDTIEKNSILSPQPLSIRKPF